jgi:hypothetical protein
MRRSIARMHAGLHGNDKNLTAFVAAIAEEGTGPGRKLAELPPRVDVLQHRCHEHALQIRSRRKRASVQDAPVLITDFQPSHFSRRLQRVVLGSAAGHARTVTGQWQEQKSKVNVTSPADFKYAEKLFACASILSSEVKTGVLSIDFQALVQK